MTRSTIAGVPLPSRNVAPVEFRDDLGGVELWIAPERLRHGRDRLFLGALDAIMETISDFCRSSAATKPEGTDLS
jgi:hypothetical protein